MAPDRFKALANAYGGDLARWPVQERVLALSLCQQQPDWTAQVLSEAAVLDAWLDDYTTEAPGRAFSDRILAQTRPAPIRFASPHLKPASVLVWSAIGRAAQLQSSASTCSNGAMAAAKASASS